MLGRPGGSALLLSAGLCQRGGARFSAQRAILLSYWELWESCRDGRARFQSETGGRAVLMQQCRFIANVQKYVILSRDLIWLFIRKVLTAPTHLSYTKGSLSPKVLVSVSVSKIESVHILFLFNWLFSFVLFGELWLILTVSLLKMEKPLCSSIA